MELAVTGHILQMSFKRSFGFKISSKPQRLSDSCGLEWPIWLLFANTF